MLFAGLLRCDGGKMMHVSHLSDRPCDFLLHVNPISCHPSIHPSIRPSTHPLLTTAGVDPSTAEVNEQGLILEQLQAC